MKIIKFKSEELLPSLAMVNAVVSQKGTLPILSNVLIETKVTDNGNAFAILTTSDTDTWLQMKAPLIEAEDGLVLCIDAKGFLQALNNLGGKLVTMSYDETKKIADCDYGNGHFTLPCVDGSEFPAPVFNQESAKKKQIDAKKLLVAIEKTEFVTSNDELRPVLSGVRVEFLADGMVVVGTDGHRLVKYKDKTITSESEATDNAQQCGFTIPKKPCSTLLKVLGMAASGDVQVTFNANGFIVQNSQFKMFSKLIEGRYPNYDSVIPQDNDHIVTIPKADFVSALKRVAPMGNTTSELLVLSFSMGMMKVSAEDIDFSRSAQEDVTCDYAQGEMKIGFKSSSLLQLIQNISTTNVKMLLKDASRAGVLCEDSENDAYEYISILMPLLI